MESLDGALVGGVDRLIRRSSTSMFALLVDDAAAGRFRSPEIHWVIAAALKRDRLSFWGLAGADSLLAKAGAESLVVKAGAESLVVTAGAGPRVAKDGAGPRVVKAGAEPRVAKAGAGPRVVKAGAEPLVVKAGTELLVVKAGAEPLVVKAGAGLRVVKAAVIRATACALSSSDGSSSAERLKSDRACCSWFLFSKTSPRLK